jgi:hypothetical protein
VHRTYPERKYGAITTTATDVPKIMCLVVFVECCDVFVSIIVTTEGHAVALWIKALRYKPEVRGINSQ